MGSYGGATRGRRGRMGMGEGGEGVEEGVSPAINAARLVTLAPDAPKVMVGLVAAATVKEVVVVVVVSAPLMGIGVGVVGVHLGMGSL